MQGGVDDEAVGVREGAPGGAGRQNLRIDCLDVGAVDLVHPRDESDLARQAQSVAGNGGRVVSDVQTEVEALVGPLGDPSST